MKDLFLEHELLTSATILVFYIILCLILISSFGSQVAVDGTSYHKACFRCTHGGCVISPSNYVAHEHRLYCRHHHTQLFKQKGNFSKLDKQENDEGVTENTTTE